MTVAEHPESLANEFTGTEFLRMDLAKGPLEAHAEIVRRLGVERDDIPAVGVKLVWLVPDPDEAVAQGYDAWYRKAREGEGDAVGYWVVGDAS